jgi:hypothetical protein
MKKKNFPLWDTPHQRFLWFLNVNNFAKKIFKQYYFNPWIRIPGGSVWWQKNGCQNKSQNTIPVTYLALFGENCCVHPARNDIHGRLQPNIISKQLMYDFYEDRSILVLPIQSTLMRNGPSLFCMHHGQVCTCCLILFMSLLHVYVHTAYPWPCCMFLYMLDVHAACSCQCCFPCCCTFMSMLHSMSMQQHGLQHWHEHAAWTWTSSMYVSYSFRYIRFISFASNRIEANLTLLFAISRILISLYSLRSEYEGTP